jgi:hypothetical protein
MQVSNICLEKHDLPPFLERNKESKEIISHYLTYKRKTYSWVQLPKTEALDQQENGRILNDTGFSYTDSVGKKLLSIMLMICTKQKNRISKTINKVLVAT